MSYILFVVSLGVLVVALLNYPSVLIARRRIRLAKARLDLAKAETIMQTRLLNGDGPEPT